MEPTVPTLVLTSLFLVPTQKMPRLLTTSASAYRKLLRKAELMGIDTQALEIQEAHVAALVDVRKKWHIPPAFRCVTVLWGWLLNVPTYLTYSITPFQGFAI
jgi:hypothetical protein